jgi:deoxyribodipyrimidine photo-lyase
LADFVATRAAGLAQLAAVLPTLGEVYARGRNTDPGDRARPSTSLLSPWLRYRLLTEQEVVGAALAAHGPGAGKFVEEVVWRSYWKGWLEGRPSVWDAYGAELARAQDRLATEGGLRRVYRDATEGTTGIDGFDDWAHALVAENWLHNHARMWFASIWVFTLRLPWALGAAFFLRHLLDGDPASNTLSWRWVAGLHTRGKHYVARAENIARYTGGRHDPAGQLDEDPAPLTEPEAPPAHRLSAADPAPAGDVALLLHEDDCAVETLPLGDARVRALAGFCARRGEAPAVDAFAQAAVEDALARAEARFDVPGRLLAPDALAGWTDLPVVTPHAPVGPAATALASTTATRIRRDWDALTWPHAARGFFQMRSRIPELLDALGLPGGAVS